MAPTSDPSYGRHGAEAAAFGVDSAIYPEVFRDEFLWGSLDTLRQFRSDQIERIEFLNALDATTLYGTGYMGGIIRVVTRR